MQTQLGRVIILVDDYDRAFDFYEKNFFCKKIHDTTINGQRYLHVAFAENQNFGIWFLKADEKQQENIGTQTGGQPTLVIYTDEIDELYQHVQSNDVRVIENLVSTPDSRFFHCLDLFGNRLTIVQLLAA